MKPANLSAEVVNYNSNEQNLIVSEKETLVGFSENGATKEEINEEMKPTLTGVLIKFSLPSSAYATMLLREFMHSNAGIE